MKTNRLINKQSLNEMKYYGFHACMHLWKTRPHDVIRVYIEQRHVKGASALLKWCASHGKAYHIVPEQELEKIADSVHHEGLCVLAKTLPNPTFDQFLKTIQSTQQHFCLLYLDGVQNPHNVGSIIRLAAHFGVTHILGKDGSLPKMSPSTYRIAQGGAEWVKLVSVQNPKQAFQQLSKAGFAFVATSSHGGISLYNHTFSPRTVIIMGSESEGVTPDLLKSAQNTLLIPGTGVVESLNVSVATGLLLSEYYRQFISKNGKTA